MNSNPYESPQSPDELTPPSMTGTGPWRDGYYLVVHVEQKQVPLGRCIVTGNPVDNDRFQSFAVYSPGWNGDVRWRGDFPTTVLYPGWMLSSFSWLLIALGALTFLTYMTQDDDGFHALDRYLWFVPVGGILCVAGASLLFLSQRRHLTMVRQVGSIAWIRGVHPDALQDLPHWEHSTHPAREAAP